MHIEMYPNKYLLYNAHETYNSIEITFFFPCFFFLFLNSVCHAAYVPILFQFKNLSECGAHLQ